MYKEYEFVILSILGTAPVALFFVPTMTINNHALAVSTPFALQDTKVSGPDWPPNA